MRHFQSIRLGGLAAFTAAALLATASGPATSAGPRVVVVPPQGARQNMRIGPPGTRSARRRPLAATALPTPVGCSTSNPSGSFTSSGTQSSVAGSLAAVLAGDGNEACDDMSAIATGAQNGIGGDNFAFGSLIGGYYNSIEGSCNSTIAGGAYNTLSYSAPYNTLIQGCGIPDEVTYSRQSGIVTGIGNTIAAPYSLIGGGDANQIVPAAMATPTDGQGLAAFIGAGENNSEGANFGAIVAGSHNSIGTSTANSGDYGFIGSGYSNTLSGEYATIGGGYKNSVAGEYGIIGGGAANTVGNTYAAIGGGLKNNATGSAATIPGGYGNTASGFGSFAAGVNSNAQVYGTFVWSDDAPSPSPVVATTPNSFLARASGGVRFYSSANLSTGVQLCPGQSSWTAVGAACPTPAPSPTPTPHPSPTPTSTAKASVEHTDGANAMMTSMRLARLERNSAALYADNAALHTENAQLRREMAALRTLILAKPH
jgi:hypothetical protein